MIAMGTFLLAFSSACLAAAAQAQVTKYEQLLMIYRTPLFTKHSFFCFFQPAQLAYLCADSSEGKCAAIPAEMSGDFLPEAAARMRPRLQHTEEEESRRASKQLLGARFDSNLVQHCTCTTLHIYKPSLYICESRMGGRKGEKFLFSGGL